MTPKLGVVVNSWLIPSKSNDNEMRLNNPKTMGCNWTLVESSTTDVGRRLLRPVALLLISHILMIMMVGVGSLHYPIIQMCAASSIFKEARLHRVSSETFGSALRVRWPVPPNIKSSLHTLKPPFLTDQFWLSVWEQLTSKPHGSICLSQKDQQLEPVRSVFLKMLHGKCCMCSREENPHLIFRLLLKHVLGYSNLLSQINL